MLFYVLCRNFLIGRKIKQSQPLIKHPMARTLVVAIECENPTLVDGFRILVYMANFASYDQFM